ncbi:MAG: GNAT family N-acetyltransferase [Nanoarchaeota archaeon]
MNLQKARSTDVDEISALRQRTIQQLKGYHPDIINLLLTKNSPEGIRQQMQEKQMLCAVRDDRILGTVDVQNNLMSGLYVDPAHQKEGIGTALLTAAEKQIHRDGHTTVLLYSTLSAESFYRKHGYTLVRYETGWKDIHPTKVPVMKKHLS